MHLLLYSFWLRNQNVLNQFITLNRLEAYKRKIQKRSLVVNGEPEQKECVFNWGPSLVPFVTLPLLQWLKKPWNHFCASELKTAELKTTKRAGDSPWLDKREQANNVCYNMAKYCPTGRQKTTRTHQNWEGKGRQDGKQRGRTVNTQNCLGYCNICGKNGK